MKKKVLLSSILTIALCLSLIAGSTFALFTDSTEFNISVSSGDVEISASAEVINTYSAEGATAAEDAYLIDENGNTYKHAVQPIGTFVNGGTAKVENGKLVIEKITPGDKVEFNINVANTSDVAISYRYKIFVSSGEDLAKGMVVTTADGESYEALKSYTSEWAAFGATTEITKTISVELPVYAGNEYQSEKGNEKSAEYTVIVEAVQGNAVTAGDAVVEYLNPVKDATELSGALNANEKNLCITLTEDLDLSISSLATLENGVYKLGGADTESITIDLNGHKLNISTTYQSAIGAVNPNATVTIKNGSMNSTGNDETTWNEYDIEFYGCNYVIENVTFDKAIALHSNATLKNVVINNEEVDSYAIWITAEGQMVTISGLTVNGTRGIKIDEQYVESTGGTVEKVTLNVFNADFNTSAKAAIVVNSTAGADITLSKVDISGVAADTTNAVWVDSDASPVTVTGGTIKE